MAVTATIIAAWKDASGAHACVRVAEGGAMGNVEYHASVPLVDDQGNVLALPQLKANLIVALQAVRNAQIVTNSPVALSGTVTL